MLLKNCRLVAALSEKDAPELADVRLEGGRIAAIAPAGTLSDREEADCAGHTLLPGLIDLHTHLTGLRGSDTADLNTPMKILVRACGEAKDYLDYGFTTIRDCGTILRAGNFVRDMVNDGLIDGPRVIACGEIITPTEDELAGMLKGMYSEADGPDEMRHAVRREMAEHADFIKIMASGSAFHPKGQPLQPIMAKDELRAVVEAAAMKDTYVAAHVHSDSAILMCIYGGVRTLEHATYMSEATLEALIAAPECYPVPTLSAMYCNPGNDSPFWRERLGVMLTACAENISRAYRAGVTMGFGTDSAPGGGQYEHGIEFQYRRELCGMSCTDVLRQATVNNAMIAGLADEVGTVRTGLRADLVLVNGHPDEDMSVMYTRP